MKGFENMIRLSKRDNIKAVSGPSDVLDWVSSFFSIDELSDLFIEVSQEEFYKPIYKYSLDVHPSHSQTAKGRGVWKLRNREIYGISDNSNYYLLNQNIDAKNKASEIYNEKYPHSLLKK